MYGTPTPVLTGNTPTGDCFPSSFTIDVPCLTDGGYPTGYTRACATRGFTDGQAISTVTCCPSITGDSFSFMCKDNEYGCHATATTGAVWTGVVTDIGLATLTEEPETRTPSTDEGIEAWGIKFIVASASSTSMSTSSSTASSSLQIQSDTSTGVRETGSNQSSGSAPPLIPSHNGLGTGSIVGIVIGVLIGVVLLALGAFFLGRRKRRHEPAPVPPEGPHVYKDVYTGYAEHAQVYQLSAGKDRIC